MKAKAPCKNCEKRKLHCHSNCEDYQAFKKQIEDESKKIKDKRDKYDDLIYGGLRHRRKVL